MPRHAGWSQARFVMNAYVNMLPSLVSGRLDMSICGTRLHFFLGDSTFTAPRQSTQPDRRIACVRIACPVLRHVPVGCGRQGLGDQLGVLQGLTSMVVPT
jgi:hypothetical protein